MGPSNVLNPVVSKQRHQPNARGEGRRLRHELLVATRRLVDQLGSTELLSMRAVAREVGVAATSVYLHFSDKEELFRAAVESDYQLLAHKLEQATLNAGADPFARLRAIGNAYCKFAFDHPGRYRLIAEIEQAVPEGGPRPQGHPAGPVLEVLQTAIRDCLAKSAFPESDPAIVLTCLWSSLHGYVELRRSKPQRNWPSSERVVTFTVDSLFGRSRTR